MKKIIKFTLKLIIIMAHFHISSQEIKNPTFVSTPWLREQLIKCFYETTTEAFL